MRRYTDFGTGLDSFGHFPKFSGDTLIPYLAIVQFMETNLKKYLERREPACLKPRRGYGYINIRICEDEALLESILTALDQFGEDSVIIPWLSPPFLDTVGYGIYTHAESKELHQLEKKERWVFPCLGPRYDREYFCDMIASISK